MNVVRWSDRFVLHARETVPYVFYAMRSGLGLALLILLLVGSWFYARWLGDLPPDFPAIPLAALVMALSIAPGPVRTFVREADLMFLLPMERRMDGYFRAALAWAFVSQSLIVLAAWLVVWPLYLAGAGFAGDGLTGVGPQTGSGVADAWAAGTGVAGVGSQAGSGPIETGSAAGIGMAGMGPAADAVMAAGSFAAALVQWAALALAWIALKAGCLYLAWKGDQLVHARSARLLALLRFAAVAASVYAFLAYPAARAVPFVLFTGFLLAAAVRLPRSMRRNWLRLAEAERRAASRERRFFGWFVDVPGVTDRPIRRRWLDWLAGRVRFSADNAYVYLFLLLLIRTDLAGILARLALAGMFAVTVLQEEWAKLFAFLAAALLAAVQGSTLGQAHRDTDWTHLYPLPAGRRHVSAAKVAFAAHLLGTTLLAACALLTMPAIQVGALWLATVAASAFGHLVWLPRRLRRAEQV